MPLVRINNRLVYFAHVPKCAGTTVEHYLEARFGPLALLDRRFGALEAAARWSATSPQHMPEAARHRMVPDGFVDATFAVVRQPEDRLKSLFLFQRDIEGRIGADMSFSAWFDTVPQQLASDPDGLDGHLRPMVDLVPPQAAVFRLEDGLHRVVRWLDAQAGRADGPRQMGPRNVFADRMRHAGRPVSDLRLTGADRAAIRAVYGQDYTRFGYGP